MRLPPGAIAETIEVLAGRDPTTGKEAVPRTELTTGNAAAVAAIVLRAGNDAIVSVTEPRIGDEVTVSVTEPRTRNELAVAITGSKDGTEDTVVPTELRSGSGATAPVTKSTMGVVALVTVELTVDGSEEVGPSGSMLITAGTVVATGTVLLFVVDVVEVVPLLAVAGLAEAILAS
jgi:hypothetical protein